MAVNHVSACQKLCSHYYKNNIHDFRFDFLYKTSAWQRTVRTQILTHPSSGSRGTVNAASSNDNHSWWILPTTSRSREHANSHSNQRWLINIDSGTWRQRKDRDIGLLLGACCYNANRCACHRRRAGKMNKYTIYTYTHMKKKHVRGGNNSRKNLC